MTVIQMIMYTELAMKELIMGIFMWAWRIHNIIIIQYVKKIGCIYGILSFGKSVNIGPIDISPEGNLNIGPEQIPFVKYLIFKHFLFG